MVSSLHAAMLSPGHQQDAKGTTGEEEDNKGRKVQDEERTTDKKSTTGAQGLADVNTGTKQRQEEDKKRFRELIEYFLQLRVEAKRHCKGLQRD